LVTRLLSIISATDCQRVGIGFPGEFREGHVIAPGNLSRATGPGSSYDERIDQLWRGFPLTDVLRRETGRDVVVVNDASLAALGYGDGLGREFTMTLGTGCGVALMIDGVLTAIRDVGAAPFRSGTFDSELGNAAVARDEITWLSAVAEAVHDLATEFSSETIHLGGGNARRIPRSFFAASPLRVRIHDNDETLEGVTKLFS
jgi:predicted NBD/HSP70 family sugar kinase